MRVPPLTSLGLACITALSSLHFTTTARAQMLTATGALMDFEPRQDVGSTQEPTQVGWRSTTFVGADGYDLFTTSIFSRPSYVAARPTQLAPAAFGPSDGYARIDDPTNPTTDTRTGTYYVNGAAAGFSQDMFSFTLAGTVPSSIRVAILYDNTDGTSPSILLTLRQSAGAGTSAATVTAVGNQLPDFYYFNINGGAAGDVYTLNLTNTGTSPAGLQVGGVAFDSVPEPSTFAIAGLALCAVPLLRRRLRRAV